MKKIILGIGIGALAMYYAQSPESITIVRPDPAPIYRSHADGKPLAENPMQGYVDTTQLVINKYHEDDGYRVTAEYKGKELAMLEAEGRLVLGTPKDQLEGLIDSTKPVMRSLFEKGKNLAEGVKDSIYRAIER